MGFGVMILAAFLVLLILARVSAASSLLYVAGSLVFVLGFWIAVVVLAFRTSVVQGLLTLFIPFYGLYFIYGVSESRHLKVLAPLTLAVWFGMFALPRSTAEIEISPTAQNAHAASADQWNHNGTSYPVVNVVARHADFFGTSGVMITFLDENIGPSEPVFRKNRAEVFFPKDGSAYSKPISVAFRPAQGGQLQESSARGYEGAITSVDLNEKTVAGWVHITGVGPDSDASIEARFEAALSE